MNVVFSVGLNRKERRFLALVPYALILPNHCTLAHPIATYLMCCIPIIARKKKESIKGEQCDNWEEKPNVGEKSKR